MFTKELLDAFNQFKAQQIDFDAYKALIENELDKIAQQSDGFKARAFDELFTTIRASLTGQDEPYDSEPEKMWYDSDSPHYAWEAVMTAIFGPDFFEFYNQAYTSG